MEMILGAVISLVVQWTKGKLETTEYETLTIALALSFSAAVAYTVLVNANLWDSVKGILLTTGAFYTFVLARFEK